MQAPESLLLVFFGMVATGKSYLASAWAERFGLPYYNSDRLRKELAGLPAESGQKEEVDRGIYTPEFSRRTYDALIERARAHFSRDPQGCVVLDGSYQSRRERDLLRESFGDRVRLLFVYCCCGEEVVKARLDLRAKDNQAVSDGNWRIYCAQKERFQTATEDEGVIEIDTDGPLDELLEQVDREIEGRLTGS